MIVFFGKKYPEIDKQAWVADGAAVIGTVKMKEYSSVWYNVTVRGDVNRIEIGAYSNVQDNSCLHGHNRSSKAIRKNHIKPSYP